MTTKRLYRRGRTFSAPGARLTETELARLRAVEQRDGVSHADWIMRHVEGDEKMASDKYFYAAESSMSLSMTYDSPCWMVLAWPDKGSRDKYVKQHSDKVESVDAKTAQKIAPQLRENKPGDAWRTVLMPSV